MLFLRYLTWRGRGAVPVIRGARLPSRDLKARYVPEGDHAPTTPVGPAIIVIHRVALASAFED